MTHIIGISLITNLRKFKFTPAIAELVGQLQPGLCLTITAPGS